MFQGATIWFWGRGGLEKFVGTHYIQHELDQKIYFHVYQGQTIYFYPQQNFEKKTQTQPPPPKRERGGGGVQNVGSEGCQDQDRIFHGIFFIFAHYQVLYGGPPPEFNFHTKRCRFRQF